MIDIIKSKMAFAKYAKNYDINNDKIRLKIEHMERVANTSKDLAIKLHLNDEDIQLAELIGLLHDIGRFEQLKKFNTFIDRTSINHGELGAKILFDNSNGIIREFISDNEYDEIIKNAILNHNKSASNIPKDLDSNELLHTKIIRDSDKIDILNLLTFEKKESAWEKSDLSNDTISDEIYYEFMQSGKINYQNIKSSADILVANFAYIFDFNFPVSIKYVKEKKYLDKIYNRFVFNQKNTMDKYINIYAKTMNYVKNVSVNR